MNRCHALGHLAVIVAGLAGAVVAFAAVPALASASPRPAGCCRGRIRRCRPAGPSARSCRIRHEPTLPWPAASPAGSSP